MKPRLMRSKQTLRRKIRKIPQGNRFYIHQLQLKEAYSARETDAIENSRTRSLNSLNMPIDNVPQNNTNVDNNSMQYRAGN